MNQNEFIMILLRKEAQQLLPTSPHHQWQKQNFFGSKTNKKFKKTFTFHFILQKVALKVASKIKHVFPSGN